MRHGRGDWVRNAGTALIAVGAAMWIVYAVGRYLLAWNITDRGFLPYHLATILPGMILRYHASLAELALRLSPARRRTPGHAGAPARPARAAPNAVFVLNDLVHEAVTGLWVGSVLAVGLLAAKTRALAGTPAAPLLLGVTRSLFWLCAGSIAMVLATAAVKLARPALASGAEAGKLRREILLVKNVLFAFAFVGGTYFAYVSAFGKLR